MSKDAILDLEYRISQLELIANPIAKDILRATVAEVPRPAFDTGSLRRSGRAYVNGKFVSSTHRMREAQGSNPRTVGRDLTHLPDDGGGTMSAGMDSIQIIYTAGYAQKMHDWTGELSDAESGPGFISSKIGFYRSIIDSYLSRIFK